MEFAEQALPTSIEDIILPKASNNISQVLSSLSRSKLSIKNRLNSILEDSEFVQRIADTERLPLVANERCGSWYIPPEQKFASAYFKSTDGHQGQWKFSLRRLNLQVLDVVGEHDGCIIVDSTRRGKSMPDALSKTVPIWCSIVNRFLFPDIPASHALQTPSMVVAQSEHAQIEARLDVFLDGFKALQLDQGKLRAKLRKPLRPEWVTRDSPHLSSDRNEHYHAVICCTASRREYDDVSSTVSYIQGAGDDSEGWSQGLTPETFWLRKPAFEAAFINNSEDFLDDLMQAALDDSLKTSNRNFTAIPLGAGERSVYIGQGIAAQYISDGRFDGVITCDDDSDGATPVLGADNSASKVLRLKCYTGKLGSRSLREQLSRIVPFIETLSPRAQNLELLFTCATGKDLSVGVALAVLCLYFDDQGNFAPRPQNTSISKALIRQRLSWIVATKPDANPARATLQSVNAFLMGRPD